ncbi:MAG TPA: hypothetical protein DCE42_23120 [Myxococcales bacterium]|nr:hypothetical protein [Deltaproteobacteria bacterium]MBU49671.1 hypothetical protein [Deltaproteobacteria bacterium]HAA57678.1 hypothetical protein [Myxococcales bacterium]|tara:strand:- start:3221 stop:3775 length:555 start_codon:yes stop_codon:yes gene_type:complete
MFVPRLVRWLYLLSAAAAFGVWLFGMSAQPIAPKGPAKVGQAVPQLSLLRRNGQFLQKQQLKGRWVLLNFWATWCPPCRKEMPSLERLAKKLPNVSLIVASVDDSWKTIDNFVGKHPWLKTVKTRMLYLRDPQNKNAARYGTQKFPETYLIDPNGVLRFKYIGPFEWDAEKMVRSIKALIKQHS